MQNGIETGPLLALLTEKNALLRKRSEQQFAQTHGVRMTCAEWYLLSRLHGGKGTVSENAKRMGVSRQAAHKLIRGMEQEGLLHITPGENHKNRRIVLTPLGQQCLEGWDGIQRQLEERMVQNLGNERVALLKTLLEWDWGLEGSL